MSEKLENKNKRRRGLPGASPVQPSRSRPAQPAGGPARPLLCRLRPRQREGSVPGARAPPRHATSLPACLEPPRRPGTPDDATQPPRTLSLSPDSSSPLPRLPDTLPRSAATPSTSLSSHARRSTPWSHHRRFGSFRAFPTSSSRSLVSL